MASSAPSKPPTEMMQAQSEFGLNLLRDITSNSKTSVVLSPLSVAIALSMAYAGSREETERELNQLLGKGQSAEKIHQHFGSLIDSISATDKNYTLETANRIYVKEGFSLLDTYKQILNDHYRGQFQSVDFEQSTNTAKIINDFVENATHDKIHDLVKADSLNALTRIILVNAIYFKGSWATKFDPKRTDKQTFHVAEGNEQQVEMMHKTADFAYHETDEMQVLGLPYQGNDVFMYILLPNERYGLESMLQNLTGASLMELVQKRHKQEVSVSLPKFKLESTHMLTSPLQKAGLQRSFSTSANFEGISENGGLQISEVVQKAFIEVNEEGTEAAASTALIMTFKSAPSRARFIADHPFAFFVVGQSGEMVFEGIHYQ